MSWLLPDASPKSLAIACGLGAGSPDGDRLGYKGDA